MQDSDLKNQLHHLAMDLGFQLFGVAPADPLADDGARFAKWLDQGDAAAMRGWLERDARKRWSPVELVEGAKSLIIIGISYYSSCKSLGSTADGIIARYARGNDYHLVLRPKLETMAEVLHSSCAATSRVFIDSDPLLEKAYAWRAGLGFTGKNNLLISPAHGSWFLLGAIVTTAELPPNEPMERHQCGECRRCLDACPTGALCEPWRLDARRCLSYWTVEAKGEIPPEIAQKMGNRLFGCDACQEVCPYNANPAECEEAELMEKELPSVREILKIESKALFAECFHNSPLIRPGLTGLKRNAAIAAANRSKSPLKS